MLDDALSHDTVTRLLSTNEFSARDLWLSVNRSVREHETPDACLIFDDAIVHKPHTDENQLVAWHFDHTENRAVKGINLLTAFYHAQLPDQELPLRVSVRDQAVNKEMRFCDVQTRKEKRQSSVAKNEL